MTNITSENAEYHIFIGEKDYWGKGIGLSATQQIIRFAKYVLKLKQIYLYVKKENENAVKLYQRCGFVQVSNDIKMILDLNYTNPPQVSVFCMVYNHEPFLEQCLEGLLMQKCLFDFEIVVGEDCSKDKSREILLKYQSKFPGKFNLLLHNQNVGAVNNQNIVLSNCTGKYIAMCEGDDYWTDPLKLQKQVDFLEVNHDYGLVHTNNKILNQRTQKFIDRILRKEAEDELDATDLLYAILNSQYIISTQTALFRRIFLKEVIFENKFIMGDTPLWLQLSQLTKFKFLNEITSIYRSNLGSVSNSKGILNRKKFNISGLEMRIFYTKKILNIEEKKLIEKYRNQVLNFKKETGMEQKIAFTEYFNNEELSFVTSRDNWLKLFFKKIILLFKNYKFYYIKWTYQIYLKLR